MLARAVVVALLLAPLAFGATMAKPAPSALDGDVAAPPANDAFADAIPFSAPTTFSVDTTGATLEAGEPRPCADIGSTVWYAFQPTVAGTYSARTAGSGFDTALAVYAADFSLVGCNDDWESLQSRVDFAAAAGETYYIQAGGYLGSTGLLLLALDCLCQVTAPVTSYAVAGPAGENGWFVGPVELSLTCTPPLGATCTETTIDLGQGAVPYTGPLSFVEDGGNWFTFSSRSSNGGAEPPRSAFLGIDRVAPAFEEPQFETAAHANGWRNAPFSVYAPCFDATSGVAWSETWSYHFIEGAYTYTLFCMDAAGHAAYLPIDIALDYSPPAVSLTPDDASAWQWRLEPLAYEATCEDAYSGVAGIDLTVDGVAANASGVIAADGEHVIQALCTDLAGNEGMTWRSVRIDTTPPDGTVVAPEVTTGPFVVNWTAADATSGVARVEVVETSAVGNPAVVCAYVAGQTSGSCERDVGPGVHCYYVRVRDVAGHVFESPGALSAGTNVCTVKPTTAVRLF